jgi:endonuclease YncB( thermonuclease family)
MMSWPLRRARLVNSRCVAQVLLGWLATLATLTVCAAEMSGAAHVIDGDSLRIGQQEMRLQGIDAPEGRQHCKVKGRDWLCGRAAAETLGFLLTNTEIRCTWSETDRYQRALVTCFRDDTNINAMMVEVGMALAYRRHSLAYIDQEEIARAGERGIWDSEFIAPWDWRQQDREEQAKHANCPVKGNVNRQQQKIYHVRGWRDYARVKMRSDEGDTCFESEGDARAAGFRAAKQ